VYQIVREALSNVAKHASATRASVNLKYDDCDEDVARKVEVRISDNGKGVSQPLARPGRGLLNMRERAELLDADIDVSGMPGKGTMVTLVVRG
jgi:signal transduction histidine kinase